MTTRVPPRIASFMGALALALACAAFAADKRVALVVGNNAYPQAPLRNAVNDARDLGAALRELGFTVIVRENVSRRELIDAVRDFGDAVQEADAALFFYAGHALQYRDRNFLLPIDGEVLAEDDIPLFALDLSVVFARMERARTRRNLIVLDACRNNPFEGSFKLSSVGLAQAVAPSGTLIAYATAPGSVASDGGFDRNGVYTKHLLKNIAQPDVPVELVFKRVREGVEKETRMRQTPWDSSSLKGEFFFATGARAAAPRPAPAGPSVDVQLQIELEFWRSVRDSNRREELQAYIDNYPQGKYVTIARLRLQNLPATPAEGIPRRSAVDGPLRLAMLAPLAQLGAANAPAATRIEDFFRLAEFAEMKLSPDGKHLAALVPVGGRQNLAVIDLATRKAHAISSEQTRDVTWFEWVNERRLVMKTGSLGERQGQSRGGQLNAVDLDGRAPRRVAAGIDDQAGQPVLRLFEFNRLLPGHGDDIVVQEVVVDRHSARIADVYRANTRSGRRHALTAGKPLSGRVENWIVDNDGVARAQQVLVPGASVVSYRASAEAPWQKLAELPIEQPGWEPLSIAEDNKSLYIRSWRGRDKAAVRLLDPAQGGEGRIIATHPYVDVSRLLFDYGVPVGVAYDADRPSQAWFDEELERIQAAVDEALPRATNTLSWSRGRQKVLVKSASDVWPGSYYLFHRETGKLEWLADSHPWIRRQDMSPMRPIRFRARDGLEIPGYLTLPRGGAAKPPLVVLVHSRAWDEGVSWGFHPEVQYLASRGYAVLQPNFRGLSRYGWKHLRSGYKQWGRAMQDDLADAVGWAVGQGHADAGRVCIYGSTYGGYAALVGATADPPLYKCAASFGAMTDLRAFLLASDSVFAMTEVAQHTLNDLIGDPSRDAEMLAAASPAQRAAKAVPVLLAHGTDDVIVPFDQAARMRSALEDAGRPLRWMSFAEEGNQLRDLRNVTAFYRALDEFLRENIGK